MKMVLWAAIRLLTSAATGLACMAALAVAVRAPALDYLEPKLLTGIIYEKAQQPQRVLFTFRRTAIQSNSTVYVMREYRSPEGTLAAREQVVYEGDRLVSFVLEELQTGA